MDHRSYPYVSVCVVRMVRFIFRQIWALNLEQGDGDGVFGSESVSLKKARWEGGAREQK